MLRRGVNNCNCNRYVNLPWWLVWGNCLKKLTAFLRLPFPNLQPNIPDFVRILALETSSDRVSSAILEHQRVITQANLDVPRQAARWLTSAIADQLTLTGWSPADIQLVAVTSGPGSFTGLRIGVTTAKTFAYATHADILVINTLDVVAAQAKHWEGTLETIIDAQRQQVFTCQYIRRADGTIQRCSEVQIVDNSQWLANLVRDRWITGSGLQRLESQLPKNIHVVDPNYWKPTAATVGQLANQDYAEGRRDDLWKITPTYFRRSAAEERISQNE